MAKQVKKIIKYSIYITYTIYYIRLYHIQYYIYIHTYTISPYTILHTYTTYIPYTIYNLIDVQQ